MAPFRVEYLCLYRPLWRWDGVEYEGIEEAARAAARIAYSGRPARILDAADHCLWQS